MKLFRFGEKEKERPGMLLRDGVMVDVSIFGEDFDEKFFATRGLGYRTRVFDFGMMGFRLVGGAVRRVGGGQSALFAYQGGSAGRVLCQMYEGSTSDLPPADEERETNQIRFRVYRRGSVTLVFWQEGPVACALASDADPQGVFDLAVAKAVRA